MIGNSLMNGTDGYTNISSGAMGSYEFIPSGTAMDLKISMAMGTIVIPIRFQAEPNTMPVMKSGYYYSVAIKLLPDMDTALATSYEAWLVEDGKIDGSEFLLSP